MITPEQETREAMTPDGKLSGVMAELREFDHADFHRIPYLRLYSDGSGSLMVNSAEHFKFDSLDQLTEKLQAANALRKGKS